MSSNNQAQEQADILLAREPQNRGESPISTLARALVDQQSVPVLRIKEGALVIVKTGQVVIDKQGNFLLSVIPQVQSNNAPGGIITPTLTGPGTTIVNVAALTTATAIHATVASPTDGQVLKFRFTQDATGGRIITWDTVYAFGTDIPASLVPSAANAAWMMIFEFHAPSGKWRCEGIVRGF